MLPFQETYIFKTADTARRVILRIKNWFSTIDLG
jgi:hypothetical protein